MTIPTHPTLLALVASLALNATAPAADIDDKFAGTWQFQPKPERAMDPKGMKLLSPAFSLTFAKDAQGQWTVDGKPFGFQMGKAKLTSAKAGGAFHASVPYVVGGGAQSRTFALTLSGKLDPAVQEVSAGRFNTMIGSGKLTATKAK